MAEKSLVLIKEGTHIPENIAFPSDFIDRGKSSFVGVYYDVRSNNTLIGVPKYYRGDLNSVSDLELSAILNHMNLICELIERIRIESSYTDYRFNPYEYKQETSVNKLDLAEFLVNDYLENGIYGLFESRFVTDGTGISDWASTVNLQDPIIDGDTVIYSPIIERKSEYSQNDIVSKIHATVLREALGILVWDRYKHVVVDDETGIIECGKNYDVIATILNARLNATFVERDKRLIRGLIAWCKLTSNNEQYYIGSTSFEHIWEQVIEGVFGNVSYKKSGVPKYYNAENNKVYEARGDLIPDSIRIDEDTSIRYFHIIDAKYYVMDIDDKMNQVFGAPANSDISKQIGYYIYLYKLYNSSQRHFTNSFFLPEQTISESSSILSYWGYAKQNNKRNPEILRLINDYPDKAELNRVNVYIVNPARLYKMFVSGKSCSNNELRDILTKS